MGSNERRPLGQTMSFYHPEVRWVLMKFQEFQFRPKAFPSYKEVPDGFLTYVIYCKAIIDC